MIVYNKRPVTYIPQSTSIRKVKRRGSKSKKKQTKNHKLTLKNKLILKSLGYKLRV